jgi:restriction system protein
MAYTTITSDKKKKTALLLCAFGGLFGLHHFYVGRMGRGLLYLCTAGLFLIGWIADLISISTGNFKDNAGAPLRE